LVVPIFWSKDVHHTDLHSQIFNAVKFVFVTQLISKLITTS